MTKRSGTRHFLFVTLTKVRVQLCAVKLDSGVRRNDDGGNMRGLDPRICHCESAAGSFPSPSWGGTSERSEDRVGFCARSLPHPQPLPTRGRGVVISALLRTQTYLNCTRSCF